ncbi:MAG TPA: PIN domain-containing protein [Bryobacteraceae bacterium]|jgi:predicted nucleic acid-binding protein|nr:PIN domain-containing protein [Bryobacteraceae bacterium]
MAAFLPDTSCMIAAVCSWHEHHERAALAIERRLNRKESMVVAAAALVEAYSVLTRLPAPHRLSPADALSLVEANFMQSAKVAILQAEDYRALLCGAPSAGISGGRIYDAIIATCARTEDVSTLLTFNDSHFRSLVGPDIAVLVP